MTERRTIWFDCETHSVDDRYAMSPEEFFRLGQFAVGREGEVHLVDDYREFMDVLRSADLLLGANISAFDLPVLAGKDSLWPLELAYEKKVLDTFVWGSQVFPAPDVFTTRNGHTYYDGSKPEKAMKWLSLDNMAHQFGLDGKIGDLKAMAKKYGGFGEIPIDDPEFREYAIADVEVVRNVSIKLLELGPITPYIWREHVNAAIDAKNSSNGIFVDQEVAKARVDELAERRNTIMEWLVRDFEFPTEGKQPWRSAQGKGAILKAMDSFGIVYEDNPTWTKTASGAPSFSGDTMKAITEGTEAEELGQALAELQGQRSLAQLALDSVHADGRAHPEITSLQRSGRKSTTKPGLTVWSARGDKAIEKRYFVAEDGYKFVELDFSQADARIVAAYSGDEGFKERFAPGSDAHEITGRLVFGDETYDSDPYKYRQIAKALGHAYAYRAGPKKLAMTSGEPLEVAQRFVSGMQKAYPKVTAWQDRVTREGERGYVVNDWGRKMPIQKDRSYTASPAMYGQSGTREIMVDSLIRMYEADPRIILALRAQIHDALLFEIPDDDLDWMVPLIKECMEITFKPSKDGQAVEFPVSVGTPAQDWHAAGHA